jgi:hypothetical protein
MKNEIVTYEGNGITVGIPFDFNSDDPTCWLTQYQIAELFRVTKSTVNEHIINIYKNGELLRNSTIRDFRIVAFDGKKRNVTHYNLDAILAVGYRVNSQRGIEFRKWASKIIKEKLLSSAAVDQTNVVAWAESAKRQAEQMIKFATQVIEQQKAIDKLEDFKEFERSDLSSKDVDEVVLLLKDEGYVKHDGRPLTVKYVYAFMRDHGWAKYLYDDIRRVHVPTAKGLSRKYVTSEKVPVAEYAHGTTRPIVRLTNVGIKFLRDTLPTIDTFD